MGNAILFRAGGFGGAGGGEASEGLISHNTTYEVTKTGNYRICCVGGGQGGQGGTWTYGTKNNHTVQQGAGGDSGLYAYINVYLTAGQLIPISIGSGGIGSNGRLNVVGIGSAEYGNNGALTTFGSYLSSSSSGYNFNNAPGTWSITSKSVTKDGENGAVLWLYNDNITIKHTYLEEYEHDNGKTYWDYYNSKQPSGCVELSYGSGGRGGSSTSNYLEQGIVTNGWNGSGGCVLIKFLG